MHGKRRATGANVDASCGVTFKIKGRQEMRFDTTKFPFLDFRDKKQFLRQINEIKGFFATVNPQLEQVFELGRRLKETFIELDPLIEELTAKICPYCGNVCCANRHGFPEYADIIAIMAMKEEVPHYDLDVDERAICQFLTGTGCVLPRFRRPYRCTWYFCDPMLLEVDMGPIKRYREFLRLVTGLGERRSELLQCFFDIFRERFVGNDPPGQSSNHT